MPSQKDFDAIVGIRGPNAPPEMCGVSVPIIDSIVWQLCIDEGESQLDNLSPREIEVLQLAVKGKTSSEIADILLLLPQTFETYRSRVMNKLGIEDIPDLVKFPIQHGLTTLE